MNRIFALKGSRWPERFAWNRCKMIAANVRQAFLKRGLSLFVQQGEKVIFSKGDGR